MTECTFLNYDVAALSSWYPRETRIFDNLPYTELAFFLDEWPVAANLRVTMKSEQFQLASTPPDGLERLQTRAYKAFKNEKRVDESIHRSSVSKTAVPPAARWKSAHAATLMACVRTTRWTWNWNQADARFRSAP